MLRPYMTAFSVLFALGMLLPSDTSSDFNKRYGPPICETYLVRPAVVATVSYGKSGRACQIVVGPNPSVSLIKSRNLTIDSNQLTEVLDEIVPVAERGKVRMGTFVNMTCLPSNDCQGTQTDWAKVAICRNGGTDDEHYATIQWNRDECSQKIDDSGVPNR